MKKYILRNKSTSENFVTEYPSEITAKLIHLQATGADLNDFTILEIDTERYPPVTKTAKDWLNATMAPKAESPVISQTRKNLFKRALKIVSKWLKDK